MKKCIALMVCWIMMLGADVAALTSTVPVARYRLNHGPTYYPRLIEAALKSTIPTHGEYHSKPLSKHVPPLRIVSEMALGKRLNIHWTPAVDEVNNDVFSVIPIPVLKGLSGFRILIIQGKDQVRFDAVTPSSDLSAMRLAQVHGWFDVNIYQHNNVDIVKAPSFESLFAMLSIGRIGAIPIGAEQIVNSLGKRKKKFPNLAIEKTILVYYHLPVFFYVSNTAPKIVERLHEGLENIIETGEMDKIFAEEFGEIIQRLQLKERKLFFLENPFLFQDTPLKRKELWLREDILTR